MKKLFITIVLSGLVLSNTPALATSGACSGHGGVDCSAGPDYDNSVICYDGWTNSSVDYTSMVSCTSLSVSPISPSSNNSSGTGACSSHSGVDCSAGADSDSSAICKDGWKESSISFLNVCEQELSLMNRIDSIANAYCLHDFLQKNPVGTNGNIHTCVNDLSFSYYKTFDPSCQKDMLLSDSGTCFCLGDLSSGVCLVDTFISDLHERYCGSPLTTSVVLGIMQESIKQGNNFLDTYIAVSCGKQVDSLTIAKSSIVPVPPKPQSIIPNPKIVASTKGKLLLQVEDGGRIWYVSPENGYRYEVTFANALPLFQKLALGISNKDLATITDATDTKLGSVKFASALKGRLLLQVEDGGRIWYVNPETLKRHEVTWANLMELFRSLSLGITNADLNQIQEDVVE